MDDLAVAAFVERHGTAFAISPTRMVTAAHCVTDRTRRVMLIFGEGDDSVTQAADPGKLDATADVTLLDLRRPVPAGFNPLVLADKAPERGRFLILGTPIHTGAVLDLLHGDVVGQTTRRGDGAAMLTLYSKQAAAQQPLEGFSGAPVLDENRRVIGVVREGPRDAVGGTLYATPVERLHALVNELVFGERGRLPPAAVSSSGVRWVRRLDVPWGLGRATGDVIVLEDPEEHSTLAARLNAFRSSGLDVDVPEWHGGPEMPAAGEGWVLTADDGRRSLVSTLPEGCRTVLRVHGRDPGTTAAAAARLTDAVGAHRRARRESRFFARMPDTGDLLMLKHAASDPATALGDVAGFTLGSRDGPPCARSEAHVPAVVQELRGGGSPTEILRSAMAGQPTTQPALAAYVGGMLGALGGAVDLLTGDPVAMAWWLAGLAASDTGLPKVSELRLDRDQLRRLLWTGYRLDPRLRPRGETGVVAEWLASLGAPEGLGEAWRRERAADPGDLPFFTSQSNGAKRDFAIKLRSAVLAWIEGGDAAPMAAVLSAANGPQRTALGARPDSNPELPIAAGFRRVAREALIDIAVVG